MGASRRLGGAGWPAQLRVAFLVGPLRAGPDLEVETGLSYFVGQGSAHRLRNGTSVSAELSSKTSDRVSAPPAPYLRSAAPPQMAGATSPAVRALVSRWLPPLLLLFLHGILVCYQFRCCSCGAVERERTLAMIKPDGLSGNYTEKIKTAILDSGFHIVKETQVQLDAERASLFYAEHSGRSFFDCLVKYITSGPVLAMVLERTDAVAQWRALIGPTDARKAKTSHPNSIRAMCGLDSEKNCVHGSDSLESAAREISFFFGEADSETVEHDEL
ncbi:probable nucleoside diphosphate kinase 5 isoform X1 [Panicum hallii]|uniref:probable nucleoside diphosphate kinase 5 isoform X1 n=1 Tax=Panicum hallii TaxID=206008 RepID=UPI000DF4F098|nr:probable nucleoside diphosphate kinase 5 isoform X1 [Panicum hallii]